MKNFFGITDDELFDKKFVKVIVGIAGSAKSSNIDRIFKDYEVSYGRYTSTNKLKRDAKQRYGGNNFTIAGGLFNTEKGKFYSSEKDVEFEHVVIDEILQASNEVFDWIEHNHQSKNIIITTDENQMLACEQGNKTLERFNELKEKDYVKVIELKKTYRARTDETEEAYYDAYDNVNSKDNMFLKYRKNFIQIDFNDMEFNNNDIFICHTNQHEKLIYDTYQIYQNRCINFLPKGHIASKEDIDINKYPIMCQADAEKNKNVTSYLQAENIATVTRFQGSEVKKSQKLYFLLSESSFITNREFYTMITRCYDINSIVLVYCDLDSKPELKDYFGDKLAKYSVYDVSEMFFMTDGRCLEDHISEWKGLSKKERGKVMLVSNEDFNKIKSTIKKEEGIVYDSDILRCGKVIIKPGKGNDKIEQQNIKQGTTRYTLFSQITKEGDFQYDFCDDIYRTFEEHGFWKFGYAHSRNASHDKKESMKYEIDLYSAYPHILMNEKLPVKGMLYNEYNPEKLNFFRYTKRNGMITYGAIISDNLANYISQNEGRENIEYLFSTDYKVGSNIGKFLHEKAHRSIETKKELKELHYGALQKKYIDEWSCGSCGGSISAGTYWERPGKFVKNTNNIYELLMAQICSELCYIMMNIQEVVCGNLKDGTIITDAVHFNMDNMDADDLAEYLHDMFKDYDFRIIEKKDGNEVVIAKTYEDLKNRKQIEADREKKRRNSKKINKN